LKKGDFSVSVVGEGEPELGTFGPPASGLHQKDKLGKNVLSSITSRRVRCGGREKVGGVGAYQIFPTLVGEVWRIVSPLRANKRASRKDLWF